jgi:hypothetical protein
MSHKNMIFGLLVLVVLLAGAAVYFYLHSRHAANSELVSQSEARSLAAKVSRLMILPTDEVPTIATVSDPSKLANQAFFQNAKVGDKVLIYTNAKLAILYDPSVDKIVTIAPINTGKDNSSGTTPAVAPSNNGQF